MNNCFIIGKNVTAAADESLCRDTARKLWSSFCVGEGELNLISGEKNTLRLGNAPVPTLSTGKEYAICVTEDGASVVGRDHSGLMSGFFSLLMKIEFDNDKAFIKAVDEESNYTLKNRMIHI